MTYHENLIPLRRTLLDLHKALIERERAEYEKAHGTVSAAAMLQLLIGDDRFSWLHPISALIVRVDELISNASERRRPHPARPPMTPEQVRAETAAVLREARDLLTGGHAPAGFRESYQAALSRDPSIVVMHEAVIGSLPPESTN